MKTAIYYFTGTGNSLAAAKKIVIALGDCEVVAITALRDTTGPNASDAIGSGSSARSITSTC